MEIKLSYLTHCAFPPLRNYTSAGERRTPQSLLKIEFVSPALHHSSTTGERTTEAYIVQGLFQYQANPFSIAVLFFDLIVRPKTSTYFSKTLFRSWAATRHVTTTFPTNTDSALNGRISVGQVDGCVYE